MNAQYVVRIAFLDVAQGDTMVVSIPETGEAVIVDCVEPDIVFAYLQEQKITSVRGLIVTHLATLYLVNKHVRKAHGYLLLWYTMNWLRHSVAFHADKRKATCLASKSCT